MDRTKPHGQSKVVEHSLVGDKSQLTLPHGIREALCLFEGDEVEFTVHPDGEVTLRAMTAVPTDERWFWSEAWQAGEREASAQISVGGLTVYDDMAALFSDIDRTSRDWLPNRGCGFKPSW